jgi:hypothetical protein
MGETHTCTQKDRIERIETAVAELTTQLPGILSAMNELRGKLDTILAKQDDHHAVLYGERGRSGLIAQSEWMSRVLGELDAALKGRDKEPGLIAEIRTLGEAVKEWKDGQKWLTRLVLGEVVLAVLFLVLIK